ncbi:phosphopantetheine-binding protein [Streptomyces griseoruber]|uniref:phosphopantetheine-binding protein n=1 Tax=Streptomyces griseoruber TaxID=1943 RepID=UPI0006E239BE|nr:phosphopantetheine-binding protein [Streptomyces griseoruber]
MSPGSTTSQKDTTEVAHQVRAAWAAALEHDDFGNEDDFFDVGGHSLLVARIMAQLGTAVGRRLPLRLFFDHPTVDGLARAIGAPGATADAPQTRENAR